MRDLAAPPDPKSLEQGARKQTSGTARLWSESSAAAGVNDSSQFFSHQTDKREKTAGMRIMDIVLSARSTRISRSRWLRFLPGEARHVFAQITVIAVKSE
jgi:hypothetical protein